MRSDSRWSAWTAAAASGHGPDAADARAVCDRRPAVDRRHAPGAAALRRRAGARRAPASDRRQRRRWRSPRRARRRPFSTGRARLGLAAAGRRRSCRRAPGSRRSSRAARGRTACHIRVSRRNTARCAWPSCTTPRTPTATSRARCRRCCARSSSFIEKFAAGTTLATTSSWTPSGARSRRAPAASTSRSSAHRPAATTSSRPASPCSDRSAASRSPCRARRALQRLLAWKLSLHGVPAQGRVTVHVNPAGAVYSRYPANAPVSLPRIAGHRDADTTDCPGDALYRQLPAIRPRVHSLAPRPVLATLALTPVSAEPTPPASATPPAPATTRRARRAGGDVVRRPQAAAWPARWHSSTARRSPARPCRSRRAACRVVAKRSSSRRSRKAQCDAAGRWSLPASIVPSATSISLRALYAGAAAGAGGPRRAGAVRFGAADAALLRRSALLKLPRPRQQQLPLVFGEPVLGLGRDEQRRRRAGACPVVACGVERVVDPRQRSLPGISVDRVELPVRVGCGPPSGRSAGTAGRQAGRAGGGDARRPSPPSRCTRPARNARPALEGERRRWPKGSGECPRSSGKSRAWR